MCCVDSRPVLWNKNFLQCVIRENDKISNRHLWVLSKAKDPSSLLSVKHFQTFRDFLLFVTFNHIHNFADDFSQHLSEIDANS